MVYLECGDALLSGTRRSLWTHPGVPQTMPQTSDEQWLAGFAGAYDMAEHGRVLLWRASGNALDLIELSDVSDLSDNIVQLKFLHDVVPKVAFASTGGRLYVFVVTADGYVHRFELSHPVMYTAEERSRSVLGGLTLSALRRSHTATLLVADAEHGEVRLQQVAAAPGALQLAVLATDGTVRVAHLSANGASAGVHVGTVSERGTLASIWGGLLGGGRAPVPQMCALAVVDGAARTVCAVYFSDACLRLYDMERGERVWEGAAATGGLHMAFATARVGAAVLAITGANGAVVGTFTVSADARTGDVTVEALTRDTPTVVDAPGSDAELGVMVARDALYVGFCGLACAAGAMSGARWWSACAILPDGNVAFFVPQEPASTSAAPTRAAAGERSGGIQAALVDAACRLMAEEQHSDILDWLLTHLPSSLGAFCEWWQPSESVSGLWAMADDVVALMSECNGAKALLGAHGMIGSLLALYEATGVPEDYVVARAVLQPRDGNRCGEGDGDGGGPFTRCMREDGDELEEAATEFGDERLLAAFENGLAHGGSFFDWHEAVLHRADGAPPASAYWEHCATLCVQAAEPRLALAVRLAERAVAAFDDETAGIAGMQEAAERSRLQCVLFRCCLTARDVVGAWRAALANTSAEQRAVCIRRLVVHCTSVQEDAVADHVNELLTTIAASLHEARGPTAALDAARVLESMAREAPVPLAHATVHGTLGGVFYGALFALHVARGDYRSAAGVQCEIAERLTDGDGSGGGDDASQIATARARALHCCASCLALVDEPWQWIQAGGAPLTLAQVRERAREARGGGGIKRSFDGERERERWTRARMLSAARAGKLPVTACGGGLLSSAAARPDSGADLARALDVLVDTCHLSVAHAVDACLCAEALLYRSGCLVPYSRIDSLMQFLKENERHDAALRTWRTRLSEAVQARLGEASAKVNSID